MVGWLAIIGVDGFYCLVGRGGINAPSSRQGKDSSGLGLENPNCLVTGRSFLQLQGRSCLTLIHSGTL